MESLENELRKMYDSEIQVDIGWIWDCGIDVSIGNDEVKGNVRTVAEVLPWLQAAIAKHHPDSKYNVERNGGAWKPTWVDPPEFPDFSGYPQEKTRTQKLSIVHKRNS